MGRLDSETPAETSPMMGDNGGIKMKKELGVMNGVAIIVGIIIGSGIFVSPKGVLVYSGSIGLSLIIWALCGLLSMVGALCYAELGTMIPRSGGDFAYIHESFGPLPAFLFIWVALLIIMPTGNAIQALTFAYYILQPIYTTCHPPDDLVRLVAAMVICFLTFINCYNVKWASMVQEIFTGAKIIALIIIIAAGAYVLGTGDFSKYQQPFEGTRLDPGRIALALYSGMFSYAGWNYLNFVVEELQDPFRNLPRAIYISLPLVTIVYLLANVAYFAVLSPHEVLASNAVAVTFGNRMLGAASWLMPFFVACSTFGGLNGGIFASSRLFFVGAREGCLPHALAMINVKRLTPVPSLVFLCFITLCMLATSDVYALINYISFVESLFIMLSTAGLLYLRWKMPDAPRPIKVNIVLPILFLLVCVFLVTFPIYMTPVEVGVACGIILSGVPVYLVCVLWRRNVSCFDALMQSVNNAIQKLSNGVIDTSKMD
ncbi:large neutral amino acids transporter small subunit 2-like [Pollicipes pollicipes]|uniref:large neutral amino acids transporter small subunit 2-like n=1 Tax=Pollicipes pollicipes TaxID=41117 RepID=UPI001884DBF5|nr:large neutral amino acids transporter small subunit 2-like [Pollicipes pollicipes]